MTKTSRTKRPGPVANPRLLLPVALILAVAAFYGYRWWSEGAAAAGRRLAVLSSAREELAKDEPDPNELTQIMADVRREPDHETARDLLAVQAEIELVRDRAERAERLFGGIAASPGASVAEQRLGARILLRRHEGFGGDPETAASMLRQVLAMSERAYADGRDARDLLRAWQAAKRQFDHATAAKLADQLQGEQAGTPAARLVELAAQFNPAQHRARVEDLSADFVHAPMELAAMRTMLILQGGDLQGAVRSAEQDLNRAPGVPFVRYAAAIVFHACVQASAEGSSDRASWVERRDAQLDWLAERAPADEALRTTWLELRRVR